MRRQRIHTAFWSALGVGGLLLAGCSDGSDATAPGSGTDNSDLQSPLVEYMGGMFSHGFGGTANAVSVASSETSEEDRQNFRRVEELIAQCMRDAGFEYVPRALDDLGMATNEFEEAYALEPAEFAKRYGYGISTLMTAGDEQTNDPNEAIRDALSDSARAAYDEALWGDLAAMFDDDGGGTVSMGPGDLESMDRGCQGNAADEVYETSGQVVSFDSGEFGALFDDLHALQERIRRDPVVEAAVEKWRVCMADAGYPDFQHPDDPVGSVFDRLGPLQSASDADTEDDGDGTAVSVAVGPAGHLDIDPEALADLQEYEIALATADHGCQAEHYQEVYRDVAYTVEQEFVDANRDELERFRDWRAESGAAG